MPTASASYASSGHGRRARLGAHKARDRQGKRSGTEDKVAWQFKKLGVSADYEQYKLSYVVPESIHKYTPDFVLPNGIIIEVKGMFDAADRAKHLLIKQQYPHLDIRFVFSNPRATYSAKSTKNKKTYADWCDAHGIKWAAKWVPTEWLDEPQKSTEGLTRVPKKGKETERNDLDD